MIIKLYTYIIQKQYLSQRSWWYAGAIYLLNSLNKSLNCDRVLRILLFQPPAGRWYEYPTLAVSMIAISLYYIYERYTIYYKSIDELYIGCVEKNAKYANCFLAHLFTSIIDFRGDCHSDAMLKSDVSRCVTYYFKFSYIIWNFYIKINWAVVLF